MAEIDFELLAVKIAGEVQKVHFQEALPVLIVHGWAEPDVCHSLEALLIHAGIDGVNPVWGELLAVGAEIGRWEPEFGTELGSLNHCSEHRVIASEQLGCCGQVTGFYGATDGGAADDLALDCHGRDAHLVEAEPVAHSVEQLEVAGAVLAEGPLVTDTNLPQLVLAGVMEIKNKVLRLHGRKLLVEVEHQRMGDSQLVQQPELVRGGGQ